MNLSSHKPSAIIGIVGIVLSFAFGIIQKNLLITFEGLLITGILTLALANPVLAQALQVTPFTRRASLVFISLLLLGQLAAKEKGTFPFTPWNMFSTGKDVESVIYLEFIGITADGSETPFTARSRGMVLMYNEMEGLLRESRQTERPLADRQRSWNEFCRYSEITLEAHRREHPQQPLIGFRLLQTEMTLKSPWPTKTTVLTEWRPGDGYQ